MGRSGTGHAVEGSTGGRDGPSATSMRWATAGATRSSGEIGRCSAIARACMKGPAWVTTTVGRPSATRSAQAAATRSASAAWVSPPAPVDGELTGRERGRQLGADGGQLVERPSLGDAEVGLAPAVIDLGGREPCRLDDRCCRRGRPSRRAGQDPGAGRQVVRQRRGEPQRLVDTDAGQRGVAPPAVAHTGPRRRRVPHQDDRDHVSGPVALDRPDP